MCRYYYLVLALALAWLCLPVAAEDTFYIYPREHWRLVNNEKVVGNGGRLTIVEDAEGEELEVVEFLPPRTAQRKGEVPLFTTVPERDREIKYLERKYRVWTLEGPKEETFKEPAERDRGIYRRNSRAYDLRVEALYETALVNAALGKLRVFSSLAQRQKWLDKDDISPLAAAVVEYGKAAEFARGLASRAKFIKLCRYSLEQLPKHQAQIAANAKELAETRTKQAKAAAELAEIEAELDGRTRPKGDPLIRQRDIKLFDEHDLRADIRYLEQENERLGSLIEQLGLGIAGMSRKKGETTDAEKARFSSPTPEAVKELTAMLAKKQTANQAARKKCPDTAGVVRQGVAELVGQLEKLWAAKDAPADLQKLGQRYKTAYAKAGPAAEVDQALKRLAKAAAAIPTVDYGRYRVTLVSRLEGVQNCLGTPIIVNLGGIERTFFTYQWPDSENFHRIEYDVELREPEDHLLEYDRPRSGGSLTGYSRDLDHYNKERLKGWTFHGETSLARVADEVFADKNGAVEGFRRRRNRARQNNGRFDASITLGQASRRQIRGMGGPDASIDAVYLDSIKIVKVEEPKLVLRQVLTQKTWIRPGEDNAFMVWLHNRTSQPQEGKLKLWLTHGLDRKQSLPERQVSVAPQSFKRVVVPWQSEPDAPWWGYEVSAELTGAGEATAATDVFIVHPNTFAVMLHSGSLGYNVYHEFKNYKNHHETFGVSYNDSVSVLPDDRRAPFIRGMPTQSIGHLAQSRAEAQRNNKLGVSSTQYLSPLCTGHTSYRSYLKHPEWFPQRLKWTDLMNDNYLGKTALVKQIWESGESPGGYHDKFPLLHLEQSINHGDAKLFEELVSDMVNYHYIVDWDGTRWDGGPITVFTRDFLGRQAMHPKTGEPIKTQAQRRQLAADLFRELKQRMWEHHPRWVYGNNGDAYGYGHKLVNLDPVPDAAPYPHYREFMKDNGSYMDEGWMSAYNFADPRNKAEHYLRIAFKQAHVMKANGGYLQLFSPQRDGAGHFNVDHIYYTLLPHLAGATYYGRLSASPWSDDGPIHFITRFCEFFLDEKLRPLPSAADSIDVDAPDLWSHEASTIRQLADNKVRVTIPVINKHPRPRLYDNMSRFSELPRPLEGPFEVNVTPPEGFADAAVQVWELSCEPLTRATKLAATKADGSVRFELDGVKLFKVVVLEFTK